MNCATALSAFPMYIQRIYKLKLMPINKQQLITVKNK